MSDEKTAPRAAANRTPRISIAKKFALLVAVAVTTAAVTMGGVLAWQEINRYAETKSRALIGAAHVFAAATAHSSATLDQAAAYQAIKGISHIPDFVYARVEAHGRLLAVMGGATLLDHDLRIKESDPTPISPLALLMSHSIEVAVPIVEGGTTVGRFVLVANTSDLATELAGSLRSTLIGAFVALAIGLLVGSRLQRGLTRPLQELNETIWRIRRNHDYGERVTSRSSDEVGLLIDGFNSMLGELEEREASLAEHRRNLEKEVSDRTHDLTIAKDVAEAANDAKSDFLATMSHEIRTPMNGVLVMAELLAASDIPQRQRRYAEVISKSGQSLLAIINDILDFSKIESGKLELERLALEPAQLAEDVTSLFAERAREKGLDLVSYISPATPRLMTGDPIRLNQIISNLVNNALKFTESGSVILKVGPDPKNKARLRVAVTDTGVGIPAHKLKDIFGAFTQADQSTTRRFGGTGLGLAISKRLIETMGGDLDVKSVYGAGSTFSFSIPLGDHERAENWPRVRETGATAAVVVDGEATQATLTRYLAEAGYEVRPAREDGKIVADLVIVDPGSLDAAHRKEGGYLLCLGTFGDPTAHLMVQQGRADGTLARPLARSEIVSTLRRVRAGLALGRDETVAHDRELPKQEGLRVLVADDTAINREVAIETLQRLGAVVATAENGLQAIAALESGFFDVVLMDVSMPELDGFEATRRIRDAETEMQRPRIPIVAVTAHVVGSAADAWRTAGMDAVLYKPFTVRSLADCLAGVVPPKPAEAEAGIVEDPSVVAGVRDAAAGDGRPVKAPLLNTATLRELRLLSETGPSGFLQRVLGLYLKHGPNAVAEMRRALGEGDISALGRAAHALKSMSLNIGADRVVAMAQELERRANSASPDVSDSDIAAMETVMRETCEAARTLAPPQDAQPADEDQAESLARSA